MPTRSSQSSPMTSQLLAFLANSAIFCSSIYTMTAPTISPPSHLRPSYPPTSPLSFPLPQILWSGSGTSTATIPSGNPKPTANSTLHPTWSNPFWT